MSAPAIPWWKTTLGEEEAQAAAAAIRERHIHGGEFCRLLEARLAERLGVHGVLLTTSGSAALLLALMAAGVGCGDEVIVPGLTFIAGAHAALLLGANVRLADVTPGRPVIDPEQVGALLGPRTRAIVAVHWDGIGCDIDALRAVVEGTRVAVVEDTAQGLFSRAGGHYLGTRGDYAAFSLGITKLLTTGEGGFVIARNEDAREKLFKLRNQGTVVISENVFNEPGFNLRFTDIQAAVGLVQLDRAPERMEAVRKVYRHYRAGLAGLSHLTVIEVREEAGELPLWTEALCSDRGAVISALREKGIQANPFHPSLGASAHLGPPRRLPATEYWADHGVILPSGTDQSPEARDLVIQILRGLEGKLPPLPPAPKGGGKT